MPDLELLSTVALLEDLPRPGLVRGQIGTIVERLSPSVAIVEFCDNEGRTYALETLDSDILLRLHDHPLEQVV